MAPHLAKSSKNKPTSNKSHLASADTITITDTDVYEVLVEELPSCNKMSFNLNDRVGAAKKLRTLLMVLGIRASYGKRHGDIFCLTNPAVGFPFLQLKLIDESVKVKVLISIENLHITAFHDGVKWFQLKNSRYIICTSDGKPCAYVNYDGKYTEQPWESIGPGAFIHAVRNLSNYNPRNLDTVKKACQIVFVHICEASRFSLIEYLVSKSFEPAPGHIFEGEEEVDDDDIYHQLKAPWAIDRSLIVYPDVQMKNHPSYLIRHWGQLSGYWICYHLQIYNDATFPTLTVDMEEGTGYPITTPISLKAALALLNSTSKEVILNSLKGDGQEHESIKKRIEELEMSKEL